MATHLQLPPGARRRGATDRAPHHVTRTAYGASASLEHVTACCRLGTY